VEAKATLVDRHIGPNVFEQCAAGDDVSRPLDEVNQKVEGAAAETHGLVIPQLPAFRAKQAEGAESECRGTTV
jgi:hypothetical protein